LGNADSTIREKEEQRQFMEDAISRNEQCYDLIIDNSGDGIVIAVDDRLIYANTTAVKKFEANDVTELIGMKLTDLIHEDFTAKTDERIAQFIKSKTGTPFIEINLKSLSGKKIFVEGSLNHIVYRGKPASLAIFRNITAQEKINSLKNDIIEKDRQIIESNEYNRAIMEFFSNMSHELKTPLNIILGSIQLLSIRGEEDLPENFENKLRKYLLIMKQNTFRLIRIVNNIIDTTKYDSGYLNISMHNQNIVSIVEEITLSAGDYIRNRGITLVFDTNIEEKIIAVDADKIERIMLNLLSNSIKFTDEGGSISVNIYDKGDSVEISVKDTGIGIPEEKQNIIFDRFGQVDKTFTRNREGSRIGLSLVRMLAEMHGGTVSVRSKIGEGSEFIIMLPANLIEEENDCAFTTESKVDKINIEFSDIYSVD
jgi:PAS domain S-box-containing protein